LTFFSYELFVISYQLSTLRASLRRTDSWQLKIVYSQIEVKQ